MHHCTIAHSVGYKLPTIPPKVKRESEEHSEATMKYLLGDVYEVSDDEDDGIQTEVERYMAEPQKRENPLGCGELMHIIFHTCRS